MSETKAVKKIQEQKKGKLSIYRQLTDIRALFFKQKNAPLAIEQLQVLMAQNSLNPQEKRACVDLAGLVYRSQQRYDLAIESYELLEDNYQLGYCYFLQGFTDKAQECWEKAKETRDNHWGLILLGLATKSLAIQPTLLQIRNHYEADLANLIFSKQWTFLKNVLLHVDWLNKLNPEVYKFTGRTLMHCGLLKQAEPYLKKSAQSICNDSEAYFHLGQFYWLKEQFDDAKTLLNQCLLISPTYTPAKQLLLTI